MPRTRTRAIGLLLFLSVFAVPDTAAEGESSADGPEQARSILKRSELSPKFSLHGFADLTWTGERADPPGPGEGDSSNSFALGEFDLYVISRLTPNLVFMGETVFEYEADGDTVADVERAFLKFSVADSFWISAGRRHTPLGYWNQAYHHGLLLQPTVDRPSAIRFEDDGGIVPTHTVGIQAGGRVFRGAWAADYSGVLANGRGLTRSEVQAGSDENDHKATGLQLSVTRETTARLSFGSSLYIDRIPADPATPGREGRIDERIWGAHFAFRNELVEFIAEYYNVRHEDRLTGLEFNHPAYFGVAVWQPWRWKPYLGYERMDLEDNDPFFGDLIPEEKRFLFGARFDIHPFTALKIEYRRDDRPGLNVDGLAIQLAYTF